MSNDDILKREVPIDMEVLKNQLRFLKNGTPQETEYHYHQYFSPLPKKKVLPDFRIQEKDK